MNEITLVTLLDGEKSFVVESYISDFKAYSRIDSLQDKLVEGTVLVTEKVSIMDDDLIVLTKEQMIKAFEDWYSEFQTTPLTFEEASQIDTDEYAKGSAQTLLNYIDKVQKENKV